MVLVVLLKCLPTYAYLVSLVLWLHFESYRRFMCIINISDISLVMVNYIAYYETSITLFGKLGGFFVVLKSS